MKLQTKIISTVILIFISMNMIFFIIYINSTRTEENLRLNKKMEYTSELLNHVNSGTLYDYDLDKLKMNLQAFLKDPEIQSISLKESEGDISLFYENPEKNSDSIIRKKTDIIFNDEKIGEIQTIYTTTLIDERLEQSMNQLLASFIIVTITISLTLYFLLRRIIRPISELTRLSTEIANGNLEIEIRNDSKNELGILSQSFMKMRDSINQKIDDLKIENENREKTILRTGRQQESILYIASKEHYIKDWSEVRKLITEYASDAMKIERTSIWIFNEDHTALECVDLYTVSESEHTSGIIIQSESYPRYFKAMEEETIISASDAVNDERTSKFTIEYLKPNNIFSMLDAPIRLKGKIVGVICFESVHEFRYWAKDEEIFAERIAEQISSFLIEVEAQRVASDLKESEARYRTMVENASEAIIVFDMESDTFIDANENAEKLFGIPREEIFKKTPASLSPVYQADGLPSAETSKRHLESAYHGDPQCFDWAHLNLKTGKKILCEVRLVHLPSSSGKLIRGSLIDITIRKNQEIELKQLRNYLSNIIDSMPSVLIGVNSDCVVTLWNKKAEISSGKPSESAVGNMLIEVYPQLEKEIQKIKESIITGKISYDQKCIRSTKEGVLLEDVTIFPLTAHGVEGAVIRIDDVTDIVRMEEMMVQSEKMLSVGGLAAGMAHEINNPLAGMLQTANVMANRLGEKLDLSVNIKAAEEIGISINDIRSYMDKRGIPRMISTISESGRRIAVIVENMLSFSRKSNGQTSSHNINDLIDRTLDLASTDYDLKKQYDFKMIKINKEYENDLPLVPCEGAKIQQVLLNILRNGAEAMHDSCTENPMFIIRTAYENDSNMIRLEIEDTGPGMSNDVRKRVFEPFFTTKPVGVGTGLGLSVSYFIITENHNGKMSVVSQPDSGSTFIVHLPLEIG